MLFRHLLKLVAFVSVMTFSSAAAFSAQDAASDPGKTDLDTALDAASVPPDPTEPAPKADPKAKAAKAKDAKITQPLAPPKEGEIAKGGRVNIFKDAKSWAFLLKNLDAAHLAKLAASPYDVVIIDSEDAEGGAQRSLSKADVEKLKRKPDGSRRLVVSYISVGEAESYRYYWKPEWSKNLPSWVGKENKDWKFNYLVKYWEPAWQNIIFGNPNAVADRIIAQGFDGIYIDRADAYYYFGDNADVRQKMRDLIIKLARYVRSKNPNMGVLVQNAEELLDNKAYVDAIDGTGKEELVYGAVKRFAPNTTEMFRASADLLKGSQARGKKIFVIEYLTKPESLADAKKKLDSLGFVMYSSGLFGLGELQDSYFDAFGKIAKAEK